MFLVAENKFVRLLSNECYGIKVLSV